MDCRLSFDDPERGIEDARCAHIPAGVYVRKSKEFRSSHFLGVTGRHPLLLVDESEIQDDILLWVENN